MGLTILIERQWWGEQEANLQNMMRLCFVMSQSSYFGSGVSSDAMVMKLLIDLNEKASGQNVTDIGGPAATMEIVGMYHTKNNIHTIVGMLLLMMVYLRRTR